MPRRMPAKMYLPYRCVTRSSGASFLAKRAEYRFRVKRNDVVHFTAYSFRAMEAFAHMTHSSSLVNARDFSRLSGQFSLM